MAITNLFARYVYPESPDDLPIVLLMHGFTGNAADLVETALIRIARYGVFVAAVGMRGRDGASGSQDASGREIYDIYDALTYIRTNFAAVVSADHAAVVGYSGGGGNALAAACKFPDAFNVIVSHFGMSDYGYGIDGWYDDASVGAQNLMQTWIGGTPVAVPDAYRARNALDALHNYSSGHIYLFHDEDDAEVPIVQSENVEVVKIAAGQSNHTASYTDSLDDPRWEHGLPVSGADIIQTEPVWAAAIAAKTHAVWTVPTSGSIRVIGYIITKRFSIWLGTTTEAGVGGGLNEVADVVYDTTADSYTVTPLTGACDVFIEQGAKTGTASGIVAETEIIVT